ncbi:biogenesis protein MshI [Shewanella maritima]|uniref:Biogenesis protein MshI n=1 Tax=Shewanella maritima TaxID=2520507 RepID=A0A411PI98_9GAMM|nr:biogenesis protein MshI [Shewanella maritima]QBF83319.1 biogenesis protein MshI [Shewanella maritima]
MSNRFFEKLAFWQTHSASGELGVFVSESAIYVYQAAKNDAPEQAVTYEVSNGQWRDAFEAMKSQFGAAKLQIILSDGLYQLLQADKPNVEPSEVNQALIWQIKDMVTEPVTNIHLDYFESPVTNNDKVNVVICSREFLVELAVICDDLGFSVNGISIEELALRHLFKDDSMAHLLVMHLPEQELLLSVVKAGQLLMHRRIRGFNQLDTVKAEELGYGMADNLSLEIQRSMDYFESQLRQPPVSSIKLLVGGEAARLTELVAANFNQTVQEVEHQGVANFVAKLAMHELVRGQA